MIKLVNHQQYGLLLWGTKLGAQTFAKWNIEADSNRPFTDLRETGIRFNHPDATLFQYEHRDNWHSYTIFKRILDWRNRSGYYAITVFVADTHTAPLDQLHHLLQELTNTYTSKYCDTNKNQIYQHAREDVALFEQILNQAHYQLLPLEGDLSPEGPLKQGYLEYQQETELLEYFSYLHPTQEPDIQSLYLYQSGNMGLPAETHLSAIQLPSYPKNLTLDVLVSGLTGAGQHDVQFKVNGQLYTPEMGKFQVPNLSTRDALSIQLISEQYEWRVPPKTSYKMANLSMGERYKLELDLKKKPETTSVTLHLPAFNNEQNQSLLISHSKRQKEHVRVQNGKVILHDVIVGDVVDIQYDGDKGFKAFRTTKKITRKNPEIGVNVERIQTTTTTTSTDTQQHKTEQKHTETHQQKEQPKEKNDAPLYQKILAVVLLVVILILLVWFIRLLLSEGDTPVEPIKTNSALVEFEKQLKAIEVVDWAYRSKEDSSTVKTLRTTLDKVCKQDPRPEECSDFETRLDQAIDNGSLRAWVGVLNQTIDTLQEQELKELKDSLEQRKVDFANAYGKEDSTYYNLLKRLDGDDVENEEDKDPEPGPNKENPAKIDRALALLRDKSFKQKAVAQNYINQLNAAEEDRVLIQNLKNYVEVCEHFEVYNSLMQCLENLNPDQKDQVNDDFKCSGAGTILDFRTQNSKLRKYVWMSPAQKDAIKDKWSDLHIKIMDVNPNYEPR